MPSNSQRQKRLDKTLSKLNVAIGLVNLAKDVSGVAPAQAAFGSVSVLLTVIRVCDLLAYTAALRAYVSAGLDGQ